MPRTHSLIQKQRYFPLWIIAETDLHAVLVLLRDVDRLEALVKQGYRLNGVAVKARLALDDLPWS